MRAGGPNRAVALSLGGVAFVVVLAALLGVGGGLPGFATPRMRPHLVMVPSVEVAKVDTAWSPPPSPTPTPAATTPLPGPPQPTLAPPAPKPPPPPPIQGPPATNPAEAVAKAYAAGRARTSRVAVAVLDRSTGTFYGAGDIDAGYDSASVVKVFIAAKILGADNPSDAIKSRMWRMIVYSDDDEASYLWDHFGGPGIVSWVASQYGIAATPPPPSMPRWWGLTRISARAMTTFYARVANDSAGGWLMGAMANTTAYGSDGFWQHFGIPSATTGWRVKQGWMSYNGAKMHSTGFVGGDRYTVALLTQGSGSYYGSYGSQTVTLMARALLPGGTIPQPPPPTPTPSPSAEPSESPSTSPSPEPSGTPTPQSSPAPG